MRVTSGSCSDVSRVEASRLVIDSIAQRPVLGYGYGSEKQIFIGYGRVEGFRGAFAGNVSVGWQLDQEMRASRLAR